MSYIEKKKGGFIVGSGGGKGGGGRIRTPVEAPDNLKSTAYALVLDVLSNGEIYGPVHRDDPLRDVYLDGTPVKNPDGTFNFNDIEMHFRYGTPDQEHIPGFPSASNTIQVGVTLTNTNHYTKLITNKDVSAVRVTVYSPRLVRTIMEGDRMGDRVGVTVEYAIDLSSSGGPYQNVLTTSMTGKGSGYSRTHRINLPEGEENWSIRVRRITPESTSSDVENTLIVQTITEVVDGKFRYPMTAIAGIKVDSSQFSSIPTRAFHVRGQIIKVPSNYDPITRTYTGTWDGTFKRAWSNNPAWVYYDILTNKLYGLGERVQSWMVDRYSLYQIGAYCDQMVPDGFGGMEPRFTCNVYIQGQEDALKVLNDLTSVFRGMSYWANGEIIAVADRPTDPVYTFTNSNVVDGSFHYSGSDLSTRYTTALVSWNDPEDFYDAKVEVVQDLDGIAKHGIRKVEVKAFGCTSRGQAHRVGNYILYTSRLETEAVSFTVGLDGVIPQPGDVVKIADKNRAGRALGGRIASATLTQITTDQDQEIKVGDTLLVNMPDGKVESRKVQAVSGRTITVTPEFSKVPHKESVWAVDSSDLVTQLARVISVAETDEVNYAISAVLHSPNKYDEIDYNIDLEELPVSVIPPRNQVAPDNIRLSDYTTIHQGSSVGHLVIEWDQTPNAINYDVQWRKDNGEWISEPRTGTRYITISNIYSGNYEARVRAINALDVHSLWGSSGIHTVTGLGIDPSTIIGLETKSIPWGIELKWFFSSTINIVSHTQIRFSRTPDFNDSQLLGDIAYPTNNYSHTSLAAGVELFYWARLIDKNGVQGPWFPSENEAGVRGQASSLADEYNELITQDIVESALGQQLMEDIQSIPDIQDQLAGLGVDLDALGEHVTNVDDVIASLNRDVDAIEGQLSSVGIELDEIGIKFDDVEAKFYATDAEIDALQARISEILGTEEWSQEKTYLEGTLVQSDGALYRAQKDVPAGVAITDTEYWVKVGDYASLGEAVTSLLARMSITEAYVNSLTGQVTAISQDVTTLASDLQSVDGRVNANTAAINDTKTEVTELDGKVTANSSAISSLSSSVTDLDGRVQGNASSIDRLETDVVALDGQVTAIAEREAVIIASLRDEDDGHGQLADVLNTHQNRAWIRENQTAIVTNEKAIARVETELGSRIDENSSYIAQAFEAITTLDEAQSTISQELWSAVNDNKAAIQNTNQTISDNQSAQAEINTALWSIAGDHQTAIQRNSQTIADNKAAQAEINDRLSSRIDDADAGNTANANAINTLKTRVDGHDDELVSQAQSIGQLEAGLTDAQSGIEANAGAINKVDTKVTAIDGRVTANSSDISKLQTDLTSLDGSVGANSQAISALTTRVDDHDGQLQSQAQSITALETGLDDANAGISANSGAITQLSSDVSAIDGVVQSHSQSITKLESDLVDVDGVVQANSQAIQSLDSRTTEIDGKVEANSTQITALESEVSALDGEVKGNAAAIDSIEIEVMELDGVISSNSASITQLQNNLTTIDGKVTANADAISGLQTTVTSHGNTLTSQGQSITQLQNRVNDPSTGLSANAAAISSLSTQVSAIDGKVTSQATSINQIESSVGDMSATVQDLSSTVASHDGKIQATRTIKVSVNSNGTRYLAGIGVGVDNTVDGMQTQVVVVANRFAVMHSFDGTPKAVFSVQGGATFIGDAMIRNASITNAKIANLAVTEGKIANLAVTEGKIANLAVTTGKIRDLAVDTLKIAGNAVSIQAGRSGDGSIWVSPRAAAEVTIFVHKNGSFGKSWGLQPSPSREIRVWHGSNLAYYKKIDGWVQKQGDGSWVSQRPAFSTAITLTVPLGSNEFRFGGFESDEYNSILVTMR